MKGLQFTLTCILVNRVENFTLRCNGQSVYNYTNICFLVFPSSVHIAIDKSFLTYFRCVPVWFLGRSEVSRRSQVEKLVQSTPDHGSGFESHRNSERFKRHGRWKTVKAKNCYVKDYVEARLAVYK